MSVSETVMRMVEPYHTSAQITAASATQSSASSTWLRFQSRRSPSRSAPPTVSCSSSAACSGVREVTSSFRVDSPAYRGR